MQVKDNIVLRRASMEDAELLFKWKNDKETIKNSITKRGVTMEEHLNWLQRVIDNPYRQLYILEIDGEPVGQLRLDIEENLTAEISYGLGIEHRGKGFGKILLEQAELLVNLFGIAELTAEVLPHNMASCKLFQKLGYTEEKKDDLYVYRKRCKWKQVQ